VVQRCLAVRVVLEARPVQSFLHPTPQQLYSLSISCRLRTFTSRDYTVYKVDFLRELPSTAIPATYITVRTTADLFAIVKYPIRNKRSKNKPRSIGYDNDVDGPEHRGLLSVPFLLWFQHHRRRLSSQRRRTDDFFISLTDSWCGQLYSVHTVQRSAAKMITLLQFKLNHMKCIE